MDKAVRILALLTCLLVLAAAAVSRQGRLLGRDLHPSTAESEIAEPVQGSDSTVIDTSVPGAGIIGYAGPVPLEIVIRDGKVKEVRALPNDETPRFFARASVLLHAWDGLSVKDGLALEVDSVSGATFTSQAIIGNVRAGLATVASASADGPSPWRNAKALIALLVALAAVVLPFFVKDRRVRVVQLILNAGVLGFWCGSFLSVSRLEGIVANGLDPRWWPVVAVLLVAAFVLPLFGHKNWYCSHVCPLGSLQQLCGMAPVRKWHLSPASVKWLTLFRRVLWAILMALMISGIWADWTGYELFAAFAVASAPWAVTAFAAVALLLSMFVPQPYCRFVCPTGTFFKLAQYSNKKQIK